MMIAHRLKTVEHAEQILTTENGKIMQRDHLRKLAIQEVISS